MKRRITQEGQWPGAIASLRKAICDYHARGETGAGRFSRIEIEAPGLEPLAWLGPQDIRPRVYWRNRDGAFEAAAIGEAHAVTGRLPEAVAADAARALAGMEPHARYYGSFVFDVDRPPDAPWSDLPPCQLWLPQIELVRRHGKTWLACYLKGGDLAGKERLLKAIDALKPSETSDMPTLHAPMGRMDKPDRQEWREMVEAVLNAIRNQTLEKAVLARCSTYPFSESPDPVLLVRRLLDVSRHAYGYMLELEPGIAWLGASPECLYARRGMMVRTEAVAGTRPRGRNAGEDERLSQELLESLKERREHLYVVKAIQAALAPLCEAVQCGEEVDLLKLPACQHLHCVISGNLSIRQNEADARLLHALHPTPAVGGVPGPAARETIRRLEPFARGWYAGPVGWMSRESAEFAVGIRSGLLRGNLLHLFIGAGIVEGSEPEKEWNELETKLGAFTRAAGLPPKGEMET